MAVGYFHHCAGRIAKVFILHTVNSCLSTPDCLLVTQCYGAPAKLAKMLDGRQCVLSRHP
jgi:hypothetical protein